MTSIRGHGYLAEFADAATLLAAVRQLRLEGYTRIDAYSPYPVEGLVEALGNVRNTIPRWMLLGGILGGAGTLALEYYSAVIDYPINVGGRPDASWPAFIPPALEMTLLCAAVAGFVALLATNGLPRLHHPLFDVRRFEAASRDGFFAVLGVDDPRFDTARVSRDLHALGALHIEQIPA
jgi:hypothetical protein